MKILKKKEENYQKYTYIYTKIKKYQQFFVFTKPVFFITCYNKVEFFYFKISKISSVLFEISSILF